MTVLFRLFFVGLLGAAVRVNASCHEHLEAYADGLARIQAAREVECPMEEIAPGNYLVQRFQLHRRGPLLMEVSTIEHRKTLPAAFLEKVRRENTTVRAAMDRCWDRYLGLIGEALHVTIDGAYDRRPDFSPELRDALVAFARRYAHFSTYINARLWNAATHQWEMAGTLRLIRAAYYGIQREGESGFFETFRTTLPLEDALHLRLPSHPVRIAPKKGFPGVWIVGGENIEPGNLGVLGRLNDLLSKDILMELFRVAYDPKFAPVFSALGIEPDPRFIDEYNRNGKRYYTWANKDALYRRRGFQRMTPEELARPTRPAPILPAPAYGQLWWPLKATVADLLARLDSIREWTADDVAAFRAELAAALRRDAERVPTSFSEP